MHRFIGNFPLGEKRFWIADKELSKQIRGVLRLSPGETVILSDGQGMEAEARLLSYDKNAVEVEVLEIRSGRTDPETEVTAYLAILKRENFELAVQKCVEVGVARVVPVITRRTVKLGLKRDRLLKIMKEAAEQSGRSRLPELGEELEFEEAVTDARNNAKTFFLVPGAGPLEPRKADKKARIGFFIGPEGGFDEQEVRSAKAAHFELSGLGNTILRAETAAIVAAHEIIFNLEK